MNQSAVDLGSYSDDGLLRGILSSLGRLGLTGLRGIRGLFWARKPAPRLIPSVALHLDRLLGLGMPLVFLIFVSLGAFLAMQPFFNATFRDAAGAVVGLGLLKNLASLGSGLVLTAILVIWIVWEGRNAHPDMDSDPEAVPDRDVSLGFRADERPLPDVGRLVASRVLAAMLAGPVLAIWGAVVGTVFGMLVARSMLGVSEGIFLGKLLEMARPIDVIGIAVKGALFGGASALAACAEGFRRDAIREEGLARPVHRAACMAILVMMLINASWFTLTNMSGPPMGPSVVVTR